MGMAASQARLLSLTARMHDVEYKAQSIQNAKIALSTQSDQVYNDYLAALDATTMTLTAIDPQSGAKSTVAATFNNLFSKNRLVPSTMRDYVLRDKYGRMVVSQEEFDAYYAFKNSGNVQNADMFAMFMLDINPKDSTAEAKRDIVLKAEAWAYDEFTYGEKYADGTKNNNYQPEIAEELKKLRSEIFGLLGIAEGSAEACEADALYNTTNLDPENKTEYERKQRRYQELLYSPQLGCAEIISNKINEEGATSGVKVSYNRESFEYYVNIFKQIEACGGCVSVEENNGFNGDAKNDTDWLQSMVSSGLMTISIVTTDSEGNVVFKGTNPSSDDNISYTSTTTIDTTALKKAEAKYEHAMKQINKKDKQFDMDLTKLDTERNALKTEMEQVKKVASDNIERTFGIFS